MTPDGVARQTRHAGVSEGVSDEFNPEKKRIRQRNDISQASEKGLE